MSNKVDVAKFGPKYRLKFGHKLAQRWKVQEMGKQMGMLIHV